MEDLRYLFTRIHIARSLPEGGDSPAVSRGCHGAQVFRGRWGCGSGTTAAFRVYPVWFWSVKTSRSSCTYPALDTPASKAVCLFGICRKFSTRLNRQSVELVPGEGGVQPDGKLPITGLLCSATDGERDHPAGWCVVL